MDSKYIHQRRIAVRRIGEVLTASISSSKYRVSPGVANSGTNGGVCRCSVSKSMSLNHACALRASAPLIISRSNELGSEGDAARRKLLRRWTMIELGREAELDALDPSRSSRSQMRFVMRS